MDPLNVECLLCGAQILAVELNGRLYPIDPRPSSHGTIVLDHGRARRATQHEMNRGKQARSDLYATHWSTCPQRSLGIGA